MFLADKSKNPLTLDSNYQLNKQHLQSARD